MKVHALPEDRWAETTARAVLDVLAANPRLRVCLPSGSTPVSLYAQLAALDREPGTAGRWRDAVAILLDEWIGLPPGDPVRGEAQVRRELIDLLDPAPRFVPIDVDGPDLEGAAARHDLEAQRLDLAVLGLGMNGHVGFNEPGSTAESPTRIVALAETSRETATGRYGASARPSTGITIGLDRLLGADQAWLLVTGAEKAEVLAKALVGPEGPDCPASYLRRHPRLTVFADRAAASRLPEGILADQG